MNFQKIIEKYLDTEAYGCNQIMKNYCRFPKFLPLPCHMEHGWTPISHALETDLNIAEEKKLMLVYSKRREVAWKKASKIPVMTMGVPFIHYRKMNNIEVDSSAKGTAVFPSHSTVTVESKFDAEKYCKDLKKLPKKFKPITICLLHPDIEKGRDKIYKRHGFEVVTAGPKIRGSLDFVKNFYQILSSHKYASSNDVGTYTFYAVEMGIPFFLYGEESYGLNLGKDPNVGRTVKMSDFILGKHVNKLFGTGPIDKITKDQLDFVNKEIGVHDCKKPEDIGKALYHQTRNLTYWLKLTPLYFLLSIVKTLVPRKAVYYFFSRTIWKAK